MKLDEAIGWFYLSMEGVVSKGTLDFYRRRLPSLVAHLDGKPVDQITTDDLRSWRASLSRRKTQYENHPYRKHAVEKPLSPYTLHQYVRCVRRLFNWLYQEGRIDHDPAKRLELPPLPKQYRRGISAKDRDKIIQSAAKTGPRDEALVRFIYDTACRRCGAASLLIEDLDLEKRMAVVHEKGRGGKRVDRPVFFQPKTARALRAWLQARPAVDDGHVFLGQGIGKHKALGWHALSEDAITQIFEKHGHASGVESGHNPHNGRHGAIREWLNRGMPLSKASQLAGHSSTKVTGDIYGTSTESELADAHDRYSWID